MEQRKLEFSDVSFPENRRTDEMAKPPQITPL
jgi:hypothetical protein